MNKIKKYRKKNYFACSVIKAIHTYFDDKYYQWFFNMIIYYDQRMFELESRRE